MPLLTKLCRFFSSQKKRLLLWSLIFFVINARAEIEVKKASLAYHKNCLIISHSIHVNFPEDLKSLILLGVPVYLGSDFRLERLRHFWFDDLLFEKKREWRISYHAITGRYRLLETIDPSDAKDPTNLSFNSLEDILNFFYSSKNWPVSCLPLSTRLSYKAKFRFFIVTNKLPPVFQIGSGGYIRWQSDSGWYIWKIYSNHQGVFQEEVL